MGGTLYLVPNLLGVVEPRAVLPARTIDIARRLDHYLVETPKAARAFLKSLGVSKPIAGIAISPLSDRASELESTWTALDRGHDIGLLSDAGCPVVADPGASCVAFAHARGFRVVPLVGPSAVVLALMASGMKGQHFCFHGYLPVKPPARADALRTLEQESRKASRTEIFIETPYRNAALVRAIGETLSPRTRVCVAADLTLATETIACRTASEWRREDAQRFAGRPAIFVLQA